ncbi:MAG: hypothetical protein A4S08_06440 [Proteobacteria bacterium SG_bin4]|nr:MAG: hypothetical protein A4S08_06440 [Proteobacteria bacterium SG_bin4]
MKKIIFLFSIIAILSGCGLTPVQQEAVSRFAKASGAIGEISASSFSQSRDAVIKMNVMSIAVNGTGDIKNLDGPLDPDRIVQRISATTSLKSYGELLLALAENTQEAELKEASDNFVDSFKSVSNRKLTNEQLESLGIIVREIGGLLVEYKKAQAIKKIVLETEDDVQLICTLLENEFDKHYPGTAMVFNDAITRLRADANIALSEEKGIQNRLIAIEAYQFAITNKEKLDDLAKRIKSLVSSLKKANTQLVGAIKNESHSISDIRAMGAQFKELSDAIRVFSGK